MPRSAAAPRWAASAAAGLAHAGASEAETASIVAEPADVFVGRVELIQALAGTPPHGASRIADTSGLAGMGKTSLVRRLQLEAEAWQNPVNLPIAFDEASAPTTPSQAFDAFVQLVEALGTRLFAGGGGESALFGEFANDLSRAEQERALMTIDADVKVDAKRADIRGEADVGVVDVDVDAGGLEEVLLGEKFRLVASAFVTRFKPLVKRRSALVTVEGWDAVQGTAFSRWLMSLLAQLPNTLVVLTRSPGAAPPAAPGAATERRELEPFSREEIEELVACYFPDRGHDAGLVDVIYAWSEGHPFSAHLAARYLRTLGDLEADAFAERLALLPEDYGEQRIKIALDSVRAPGAAELAEAARALSVSRRFDTDVLRALVDDEASVSPEDAIERLRHAGIVEPVAGGDYRVRSFIREPLEEGLAPARRRQLHRRAADHHYAILSEEEPELHDAARPYEQWYRYERPEWQAQLREWLYHTRAAASTAHERERARLQFVRVFLDAFWWWGCYLDFPFCRDLVADWIRARDDDDEWVDDLQLLLRAYPTGYRKEGDRCWRDVRAALLGVRAACGVDGPVAAIDEDEERHTRALLDNFLAHSCRYRSTSTDAERALAYEQALGYYDEAAGLFAAENDSWELAWTLFETAELHADNGDLARAREVWRRAAGLAVEEDDWELKANLHRLVADIRWRENETAAAFDAHARAVMHAYLFQCRTASNRPDTYTLTFYREQLDRVFARLRSLERSALPDAVERLGRPFGAQPAVDAVAAALAAGDPRALAGLVFPEAPKDDELLEGRSAFTRAVRLFAEDLGDEPERDLAEVAP